MGIATGINWNKDLESTFLAALDDDATKINAFISLFEQFLKKPENNDKKLSYVSKLLTYISQNPPGLAPAKFLSYLFYAMGTDEIKNLLFLENKNNPPLLYQLLNNGKIDFSNTLIRVLGISANDVKKLRAHKYSDPSIKRQLTLKLVEVASQPKTYDALIAVLVKFGAELVQKTSMTTSSNSNNDNNVARAPIHAAIAQGDFTNFQLILSLNNSKQAIEQKTVSNGHTPLHYTIIQRQFFMAKELLAKKADLFAQNIHGQNAFHLAIICDQTEIFEELLQSVNPKKLASLFSATDKAGFTLLHYIAASSNQKFVELIQPHMLKLGFDQKIFDNTINKSASIKINGRELQLTAYHFAYLFGNENLYNMLYGASPTNRNTKQLLNIFPNNLIDKNYFLPIVAVGNLFSSPYAKSRVPGVVQKSWTEELAFFNTVFDSTVEENLLANHKKATEQEQGNEQQKKVIPPKELSDQQKAIRKAIEYSREQIRSQIITHNQVQAEEPVMAANLNADGTFYGGNKEPKLPQSDPSNKPEPQNANDPPPPSLSARKHFEDWQNKLLPEAPEAPAIQNDNLEQIPADPMPAVKQPEPHYILPLGNPNIPNEVIVKKFEKESPEDQKNILEVLEHENHQVTKTVIRKEDSNEELIKVAKERDNDEQNKVEVNKSPDSGEETPPHKEPNNNENNAPPPPPLPLDEAKNVKVDSTRNLNKKDIKAAKTQSTPDIAAHLTAIRGGIALKPAAVSERPVGKSKAPVGKELEKSLTIQELLARSMANRREALEGKSNVDKRQGVDPSEWEEKPNASSNRSSFLPAPKDLPIAHLLKPANQSIDADGNVVITFGQNLAMQINAKLSKLYEENLDIANQYPMPQTIEVGSNDNNAQQADNDNKFFSISLPTAVYNKLLEDENAFENLKASIPQAASLS